MLADFFTKPLQGALFRKFRKLILNLSDPADEPQECVGTRDSGLDSGLDESRAERDVESPQPPAQRTHADVVSGKKDTFGRGADPTSVMCSLVGSNQAE